MNTHPEQWAAMLQRPGSSWGFGALLKDTSVVVLKEDTPPTNNPCRTWDSNPQPSSYKSDSLSIRPRLPLYFGQKGHFKVKIALKLWICFLQTHSFWLLKTLTDGLEWYGLHVMFLSAVWTHSDGTHSLQRIHWWASYAMLHFSKSDEETNSSTSWITKGWAHFLFVWTIPLNTHLNWFCKL